MRTYPGEQLIIGVPREVKTSEFRVGITPVGVRELVSEGHSVLIEHNAGQGSAIRDEEYEDQGATIVPDADEVFGQAHLVLKVKEPQPHEIPKLQQGQILFTYLHLAAYPRIADGLRRQGVIGIAYETVQHSDGRLPLLAPMSEIAGRIATQVGAFFLEKPQGGRGVLLGGVPGVRPGKVVIIGAGNSGSSAAAVAVGLQASVVILDRDLSQLRRLDTRYRGRIVTLASNRLTLEEVVLDADLVIGAVLVPGAVAPKVVTDDMVRAMRPGTVLVDIAIDQGGCFGTSRETTHDEPVFSLYNVLHYAVGNIPGSVPHTSTYALTNATLPYLRAFARHGVREAVIRHPELQSGVNVVGEKITNRAVSGSLDSDFVEPLVALDAMQNA